MYPLFRGLLLRLLRAPAEPPEPPAGSPGSVRTFRAAKGFLSLQLIPLGVGALLVLSTVGFMVVAVAASDAPPVAMVVPLGLLAFVSAMLWFRYMLIRLDYDMRYYVVTDRSMRIREGAMHIHEHTYTYANVQNVSIQQGPLERLFGISNVRVQTAGGGGVMTAQQQPGAMMGHGGVLRGIENAEAVRDQILALVKAYRDAGLGDAGPSKRKTAAKAGRMSPLLVERLREVRDEVRELGRQLA